jgi:ABC-type multidrug transport system fused ATPase/permease subunit
MQITKDIKNIWQYLQKYKKKVYFIIFLTIFGSAVSAVVPYIYGRLVDVAIKPSSAIKIFFEILGLWLILTLFSDWVGRFSDRKGTKILTEAGNDMILDLSSHILKLPVGFHKEKKIGEILQRISRAADFFDTIVGQLIYEIIPGILRVVIGIGILVYVEWKLAMVLLVIIIVYIIATFLKVRPLVRMQKVMNRAYEKGYGDIYNAVHNVQVVKSSIAEKIESRRNIKNFGVITDRVQIFNSAWLKMSAWQQTIFGVGFVLVFGAGIFLLRTGIISAGELIMFVGYISLVQQPIAQLSYNYRTIKRGTVVIERALKLKNIKPEKYEQGIDLKEAKGEVIFENIGFAYKKGKAVLKDINFKVNTGEVIALVGHSGVGKTTLIDLISRYIIPTKGRILLDGHDIQKINLHSLRKNIAIVPQEITLFNDTIKNNIAYGKPNASMKEIIRAAEAANAQEFIMKFPKQYKQIVGERGVKLSTGQKQRIAIARALLREPKILILDEATSALDSVSEKLVHEAVERLIKGRTTFIIAHRLSTISHANKILVINKGRIMENGTHSELMANQDSIYRKFYMMQSAFKNT